MTGVLGTAVARGPQVALNRAWPTAGRWSGPPGRNLYRPGRASRVHGGAAGALWGRLGAERRRNQHEDGTWASR